LLVGEAWLVSSPYAGAFSGEEEEEGCGPYRVIGLWDVSSSRWRCSEIFNRINYRTGQVVFEDSEGLLCKEEGDEAFRRGSQGRLSKLKGLLVPEALPEILRLM